MDFYVDKSDVREAIEKLITSTNGLTNTGIIEQITVHTSAGHQHYHHKFNQRTQTPQLISESRLQNTIKWLETSPLGRLESVQVHYAPQANNPQRVNITLHRGAIYDKISVADAGHSTAQTIASILDEIAKHYTALTGPVEQTQGAVLDSVRENIATEVTRKLTESAVDLRQAVRDGLGHFLSHVTEAKKQFGEEIAREHIKLREETDAERNKLRSETEAERNKLRDEYEAERKKLNDEREAFEKEKREHDDRRNTHMRRQLLTDIQKALKSNTGVQLSKETSRKAWPITAACITVACIALYVIWRSLDLILSNSGLAWYQILPFTSSVLLFVSTAIYFVRWNDAWTKRHANLETRNQLLQLDMARASWFAEFLFEYKDAKGAGVPEAIIQVMTRNLFELQADPEIAKHPVDDVAKFLERVNRIRLGEGEVEMQADAKRNS